MKELQVSSMKAEDAKMGLHKHDECKRGVIDPEASQTLKPVERGDSKTAQYTEIYLDMD